MLFWQNLMTSSLKFDIENSFGNLIAGVDEAGRGPWAGPVVAGAVVFLDKNIDVSYLDDSKKISPKKREKIFDELLELQKNQKIVIGIGQASAQEIDEHNILQATFLAMNRAVEALNIKPKLALIDGNQKPKSFVCDSKTIVGGDGKSFSISAASIVAKVYRDKLMKEYALKYPYYEFEKNAGYGVPKHIEGLKKFGVSPIHRLSYKPVKIFV